MQNFRKYFFVFLGIVLIVLSYSIGSDESSNQTAAIHQFQKELSSKETDLQQSLVELQQNFKSQHLFNSKNDFINDARTKGFSFFIFIKGKLKYWSEDYSSVSQQILQSDQHLIKGGNAWQEKITLRAADTLFVGLITVLHQYPYQNQFLHNHFQKDFEFSTIKSLLPVGQGDADIQGVDGENIFSLQLVHQKTRNEFLYYSLVLLSILGFLLVLHFLPLCWTNKRKKKVLIAIFLAFLIRLLLFYFPPLGWQVSELFQPTQFAINSWCSSLGDFILHILLFFYIVCLIPILLKGVKNKTILLIVLFVGFLATAFAVNLIQSAVLHSTINYNLNKIFQLSILSYLCFVAFALFIFGGFVLLYAASKGLNSLLTFKKHFFAALICSILVTLLLSFFYGLSAIYLWGIIPWFLFIYHHRRPSRKSLSLPILLLLMASLATAYSIYAIAIQKEPLKRKLILEKLAEEKDPVAEYLFKDVQIKLRNDKELKDQLKDYWSHQEKTENYLKSKFFNGYWEKYKIVFTPCMSQDSLLVNTTNEYTSCHEYFAEKIRREGDQVSSNNMFQLRNFPGRIEYLAEVDIPVDTNTYTLYIELLANSFNENEGYPKLLIDDKSQDNNVQLNNYSYAVYENKKLVYHFGAFNYSLHLKITELATNSFYVIQSQNTEHTLYQKDRNTTIVLSHPLPTAINFFTYWAYLFVIFALIFLLLAGIVGVFPFHYQFPFTDFSAKIQFFLIGSLLTTLLLFSLGTTYYIQKQYKEKNFKILEEKVRSINLELEQKIGREEFLAKPMQSYIGAQLIKLSNIFYSDINIYNTNGQLYSSSRPEVFEKGLKSRRMNPMAYHALVERGKSEWMQEEKIGNMNYLSAYIPFKNYNNQVLAYLNLPYFSKQGELKQEISNFLVSTINIYVGIFTLALLVSVLLINQLSRPLLLIRNQISRLKLGSSVELIQWDSNDEIGALVKEYNRIAIELSQSAEQLAQSEREGAWREMAKQVAHEIKNPLTPMRLSVQHLQRMGDEEPSQLKEQLQRTTQTLIEQIDTLTNIADAFSTFAKLPERNLAKIDLLPILQSAIGLYDQEIELLFTNQIKSEKAELMADKDQLLRLFNNLIKNATQAIESIENGKVEILLSESEKQYHFSIYDNGQGIEKSAQNRIFEPNFTTKSGGTGLGLAMSKSIVTQMGGEITFESTIEEGTTFYVTFDKV